MVGIGFIDNQKRSAQPKNKYSTSDNTDTNSNNKCLTSNIINGINGQCNWPQDRKLFMDQPIDAELVAEARESLRKECESTADWKNVYCQDHYDELLNDEPGTSCWRYIIYYDKDVEKAVDFMKRAMIWRRENKISELNESMFVKEFWHWSPCGMPGVTKEGHGALFVCGRLYRKPDAIFRDSIRKYILYQLFSWDKAHRHDLSQMVIIFETSNTGFSNIDADLMSWSISIIDFIPARIASVFVTGVPMLIRPLVRLIISWLPERFKRIVHCGTFDELVRASIDDSSIPVECGGTSDSRYRIAPATAPWLKDTDMANDEALLKAMKYSICFGLSQERLEFLEKLQLDYEQTEKKK